MLAARRDAVDDAFTTAFPRMVSRSMSIDDARGRVAGRAAADRAGLAADPALRAG